MEFVRNVPKNSIPILFSQSRIPNPDKPEIY